MKHIKVYERFISNEEPEVGDYVICHEDTSSSNYNIEKFNNFIDNKIGIIIGIQKEGSLEYDNDGSVISIDVLKPITEKSIIFIYYPNLPEEYNEESNVKHDEFINTADSKYFAYEKFYHQFFVREIVKKSKKKEDLEFIINVNKYNL